ncbi:MAG: hypothetical protein FJY81_05200, partial [Candidatus Aminicenantes bacterium]|nr:hypothetical protein [Candidatus Aminicenantes bacterium]
MALVILFILGFPAAPARGEVFYPWKDVCIGALEGKEWFGLVFAVSPDAVFAFRFSVSKEGQTAEGHDLFYLVSEVGPHSPDGQFARIRSDLSLPFKQANETPILIKPGPKSETMTLEWSRQDEKTVIGRIRVPRNIDFQVSHYFPWNLAGRYRLLADGQVDGETGSGKGFHYLFWTDRNPMATSVQAGKEVSLTFSTEKERTLYFVAGVGEDPRILSNHIYRYKNRKTIDSFLLEEEQRYRNKRVKVDGLFGGVAEAITNNLFWMTLYQPGRHRLYLPAGRRWIFQPGGVQDHWTIFEWDSFFNALQIVIESTKHARDILEAVLETQYPNGNIPNWRGRFGGTPDRSQPPVGAFCVLKLFGKTGDMELLKFSYPYLKKWHAFWKKPKANGKARRDGNGDGLLEWGSDAELVSSAVPAWEIKADGKQRAMWESGQDDLPN